MSDQGQRITDEINADPEEVAKLRKAIEDADAGKATVYRRRSRYAIFERCPQCDSKMIPEHAHYRCPACGFRDSCCDG